MHLIIYLGFLFFKLKITYLGVFDNLIRFLCLGILFIFSFGINYLLNMSLA